MDTPVTAKAALLQVLAEQGGYGLELIDRVRERTAGALVISQGSVYPALKDLQSAGMLTSREGAGSGGRMRRYFEITEVGRKLARAQRSTVARLFALMGGV